MSDERLPTESPPTEKMMEPPELAEPPQTKWPKVIGVISLIYAICGLLCMTISGVMIAILPALPEMLRGGVAMPPIIRITGAVQCVLSLCLGILMLTGAVKLLRRKRSGVGLLKNWAVLRIILVLLGVGVAILTGPAQIQMARQQLDFANRMFEQNNMPERIVHKSDDQLQRKVMLQTGGSLGLAIYPIFLGLYLSRKKIKAEVAAWADHPRELI